MIHDRDFGSHRHGVHLIVRYIDKRNMKLIKQPQNFWPQFCTQLLIQIG